ncbi:MAG: SusC/RagA family TonB-linked outer membrane protein [Bacteroidetes bacterium]|nr:SusC/RagA family TonB-linked outer membrane protein [Bacteroidota bacterium]MBS1929632.1 SusC/RagA family TonB-linked outer membrane protein [Bacteroidota bacterium]
MRKLTMLLLGVLFLFARQALAQNIVTGKVTDQNGAPISNVTVQVKNTKSGTTTGEDGTFKLSVHPNAVLVISGVGYETKEVSVGSRTVLDVSLKLMDQSLSEVVVTTFGIKREKKALGYAVSTVGKESLEMRSEGDIARVLSGKAPGLNILNTSGLSGSGTNITIRAISTITGNSQPLFIVDGVPFDASTNAQADFTYGHQTSSRFLDLDPNNIENISILKGLSATTLYGEQGRNGVILITTKNGSTQKTNAKNEVTVSQSVFATQAVLPDYNRLYGGGFDQSLGLLFFSNWGAKFTDPPAMVQHPYDKGWMNTAFPQYKGVLYPYKFYNSVHEFFRTGVMSNTSINIAGSTPAVNYNMNYSYTDDQGYLPENGMIKNSIGMGGTAKLTNKITISGTINYVSNNVKSPPTSNSYGNNAVNTSIFGNVMYTPTAIDLMNLPYENPLDHSSVYYRNGNDIQNPRWTLYNSFTQDNVKRTYGQIQARYEIMKSLNLSYRVGYDSYTEYETYAQNKGGISTPTGIFRESNGNNTIWDHSILLNYNHNINANFSLNVDAGANRRKYDYSQTGTTGAEQLVYGIFNQENFVSHSPYSENGSSLNYVSSRLETGVFAQAQIGYQDYTYLTLGGRNSWTSTVEDKYRSILYPSVSIAFLPTSAFQSLKNNNVLNYLKLRIGYSTSANFPPPYSTRPYLYTSTRVFLTNSGQSINVNAFASQLPNPNLKPELLKETEAGLEAKLFKDKISVDFTVYQRVANDQILNRFLDPASGYLTQQINAGKVTNKGIEIALGITPISNKDWKWHLDGLFSTNKSMVSGLPEDQKSVNISGYSNEGTFAINGQPLGVIMASAFEKDPKSGQWVVGSDGNYIAANDIAIIANPNPKYNLTGITTLTYKGISFRMQWDYVHGGTMFSGTAGALLGRGVTRDTEFDRYAAYILPGVDENGQPNRVQLSTSGAYYNNTLPNGAPDESAVFDQTCIRLREASFSYSFPAKLLRKLPIGSLSITLSGNNLWYNAPNFPKHVHFDPDVSGLGVSNGRGLEFLTGPSARRMGASLRITF